MSYILDALRKSERDRRQSEAISLGEFVQDSPSTASGGTAWLVAGSLLVLAVVVAGVYWYLGRADGPAAVPPVAAVVSAPVEPPAPPVPAAPPVTTESPPPLRSNPMTITGEGSTRDLAEQARTSASKPPSLPQRAPVITALPKAGVPAADAVKFLRAMPPDFQKSLPELTVNIHVYSPAEAERILYINNEPYRAGQKIRDDLLVEEIVPDGVVINHQGRRFKLPRPS